MVSIKRDEKPVYQDVVHTDNHWIYTKENKYLDSTAQSGLLPLGLNTDILLDAYELVKDFPVLQYKNYDYELIREASKVLIEDTDLGYVQWQLCGSLATEAAIKMAYRISGKFGVIGIPEGYNGCTMPGNSINYKYSRSTPYRDCSNFVNYFEEDVCSSIEKHHNKCCAVIVEPLIYQQGCVTPGDYAEITRLCKKYNLPLIVDETFTGGYRTGPKWHYTQTALDPDMVIAGKGINNGATPVSVLMLHQRFYDIYMNAVNGAPEFFMTQSGNPIGCATVMTAMPRLAAYEAQAAQFEQDCRKVCGNNLISQWGYLFNVTNPDKLKEQQCIDRGLLAKTRGAGIICTPPFTWTVSELATMNSILYQ